MRNPKSITGRFFRRIFIVLAYSCTASFTVMLAYNYLLTDASGRPVCHKVLNSCLDQWMNDNQTDLYPNIGGSSRESLRELHEYWLTVRLEDSYNYVSGLKKDDPNSLVLMYLNRPTRWVWHGAKPFIWAEKAWMIVPVDFTFAGRSNKVRGELSESVSEEEFKQRLSETIEFLKKNKRPNWEKVVAEHTQFLEHLIRESK